MLLVGLGRAAAAILARVKAALHPLQRLVRRQPVEVRQQAGAHDACAPAAAPAAVNGAGGQVGEATGTYESPSSILNVASVPMEGFHALLSLHRASEAAYKAASGRGTERSPVHIQVLPLVQPLREVCQQQPQPAGTHTDQVGGEQSLAGLMPEIQTAGSRLEQQPGPPASTTKSHRSGSGRPRSTMGQCAKSSSMRLRCCQIGRAHV